MTVIAYDGKQLAIDKQGIAGSFAFPVTKVRETPEAILAWCGGHSEGQMLADWWEAGADPESWPDFQEEGNYTTLVVMDAEGAHYYEHVPRFVRVESPFFAWGVGRDFALGAMAMGADAAEAVEVASELSAGCGQGLVLYPRPPAS